MNVFLNGVEYQVNLAFKQDDINDIALLSSGRYILQDINGVRLISNPITYTDTSEDDMISLDDSTMKDSNGLFLNYKESE